MIKFYNIVIIIIMLLWCIILQSQTITVFPNPVGDNLYVQSNFEFNYIDCSIYTIDGRLVTTMHHSVTSPVNTLDVMNTESLSTGIYILYIRIIKCYDYELIQIPMAIKFTVRK